MKTDTTKAARRSALNRKLLVSTTMLAGALLGYGRNAYAQQICTNNGGSTFVCSGTSTDPQVIAVDNAEVSTSGTVTVNATAGDAIAITGYGTVSFTDAANTTLTTTGDNGIEIQTEGNYYATPGSVTVDTAATINANSSGIEARNYGTGATTITVRGDITTTNGSGVYAYISSGDGIATVVGSGSSINAGSDGVEARLYGSGDINITALGNVTGDDYGIYAYNDGTGGDVIITTGDGDITGVTENGISAESDTDGTISVTTGSGNVLGGETGIYVDSFAEGLVQVTTGSGSVTGTDDYGIYVYKSADGDVEIKTGSGAVYGGDYGIYLNHNDTGVASIEVGSGGVSGDFGIHIDTEDVSELTITVDGDVEGLDDDGIYIDGNENLTANITVQSGATVSSVGTYTSNHGIYVKEAVGNITVAGTVTAVGGTAIRLDDGDDTVTLQGGFAINGIVDASEGTDTLVVGGADTGTDGMLDVALIDADGVADPGEQFISFEQFAKRGNSTFTLTGVNDDIGTFSVEGGVLNVNATMVNTLFDVTGGALAGTGTIGTANIASGAALAPGAGGIGTLSAMGNVAFAVGSTFQVETRGDGSSDLLDAGGDITIDGGTVSVVSLDAPADYTEGTRYTIATAAGAVTGTFDDLQSDSAFIDYSLAYDASNVYLNLDEVRSFTQPVDPTDPASPIDPANPDAPFVGLTFNQLQVASSLDNLGDGDGETVRNALLGLNVGQALNAFNAIQGEAHAGAAQAAGFVSGQFTSLLTATAVGSSSVTSVPLGRPVGGTAALAAAGSRYEQGRVPDERIFGADISVSGPVPAAVPVAPAYAVSVWLGGFGASLEIDGDGNASGLDTEAYGIAGGIETDLSAYVGVSALAGLSIGYSRSEVDVNARLQDADVDSLHLGLYASAGAERFDPGLSVRGALAYSWHHIDTTRSIVFGPIGRVAEANYDAETLSADLEARYNVVFDAGLAALSGPSVLAPFVRLQAGRTDGDAFSETGAGALNLTGDADYDETTLAVGLSLGGAYDLSNGFTWKPTVSVAYERAFGDDESSSALSLVGSSTPFAVRGPDESEDRLRIGTVNEFAVSQRSSLVFATDSLLSEDRREFSAKAAFKLSF